MTSYVLVGRYDLLPLDWEGYNGLIKKDDTEVTVEVCRQVALKNEEPNPIGVYTAKQFEEAFNQDLYGNINTHDYFIRII